MHGNDSKNENTKFEEDLIGNTKTEYSFEADGKPAKNTRTNMTASYLRKRALTELLVCLLCSVCLSFRLPHIQTRLASSGQHLGIFRGVPNALDMSLEGDQANTAVSAKVGMMQNIKNRKSHPAVRWTKAMVSNDYQ